MALDRLTTRPQRFQHAGQHRNGQRGRGDDVDLEGPAQLGGRDRRGGAQRLDGGGVVDQDVDVNGRHRRCGGSRALLGVAQVGGNDVNLAGQGALRQGHRAGLGELAGRSGDHYEAGPGGRQLQGDGLADAAPGAGDQRRPAGELSCHRGLPC